ncbi:hypothetical protein [Phocaeicola coprocola]|jgi:hypothetical protein
MQGYKEVVIPFFFFKIMYLSMTIPVIDKHSDIFKEKGIIGVLTNDGIRILIASIMPIAKEVFLIATNVIIIKIKRGNNILNNPL